MPLVVRVRHRASGPARPRTPSAKEGANNRAFFLQTAPPPVRSAPQKPVARDGIANLVDANPHLSPANHHFSPTKSVDNLLVTMWSKPQSKTCAELPPTYTVGYTQLIHTNRDILYLTSKRSRIILYVSSRCSNIYLSTGLTALRLLPLQGRNHNRGPEIWG